MGTVTTIFMIASLILVAFTMFAGFMGIVGPRCTSRDDDSEETPRLSGRQETTSESQAEERRAA